MEMHVRRLVCDTILSAAIAQPFVELTGSRSGFEKMVLDFASRYEYSCVEPTDIAVPALYIRLRFTRTVKW